MSPIKDTYDSQGFVVVPGLVSLQDFSKLQEASDLVINRTREGSWPYRRTVGKQFPPFDNDNPDSWGVQHVMHPDLQGSAIVFSNWYTSDDLTRACADLLHCGEEDLQLELFNLLINPLEHSFALRWHRDDVKENALPEEEQAALDKWHTGIQWNTALYEDSCLYVVPGSHQIARTPEQRVHSCTIDPPSDPLDMPGAVLLTLKPGETVFYNSNILHCAAYDHTVKRATLHACTADARYGTARGRNILQHGLSWVNDERFKDQLTPRGKRMLGRLLELQKSIPTNEISYSLEG
ncbi:MAG: hypothetical protein NXY57DRAFT_1005446 [Lentinula lateritia]|uniref:Phytanoyl-CoA dioxygenase n=1 Tax=Lentinula lateritia TaxID=40482 RepID=A0ABQ8VXK1_9AGAR|nr:hypothetical protein EV359DRAFT_47891 [Lentinula novae-zelandiae]KAJ3931907.1 MAG: hypothetical protein NXY57DRAFT_1005446 [Lentinula lateritia]KAJ4501050.1 hypothetical protein C8R41DRAFT_807899 [Lentinula lateritia]